MKRPAGLLLIALALSAVRAGAQESVFWNSDANAVNLTSDDRPMDGGFRFQLGVFTGNFTPTAGNAASWSAYWKAADHRTYQNASKRFAGDLVAASNAAPFTAGRHAYIWGFRGDAASGEWILFRAPGWSWPDANGFMFHEWFAKDAAAVLGQIHASGSPFLMKSAAVANAAPPAVTWDQWRGDFLSGEASDQPDDDPDHDGTPNLLEFVFGTEPLAANAPVATPVVLVSGHLEITIPRRIDRPATLSVEVSGDLATWHSGPLHTQTVSDGLHALVARDLTPLDAANPRRFIRLRASLP